MYCIRHDEAGSAGGTEVVDVPCEIVERHKKRIESFTAGSLDVAAKALRYSTLAEATHAYERRQMSDRDFAMHLEYFERRQLQQQPRQGARK